jgi:hypothetical protein
MTCDSFVKWLQRLAFFRAAPASLYLIEPLLAFAENSDLILCCLPRNIIHDKWISRYRNEEVLCSWCRHQGRAIIKFRSEEILSHVCDNVIILENINAGSYATGIFPCDPDILQSEAYGSSCCSREWWNMQTKKGSECRRRRLLLLQQHVISQGHTKSTDARHMYLQN